MPEQEQERYKIVFRGELVENLTRDQVEKNFRERLRFSDAVVAKIFSGKAMVLKSDLDRETADRYARALWQAGARCVIAPMVEPPPLEAVMPPPSPEPEMVCPKCGQKQPAGEVCIGCGLVIAKYRQRQEEEAVESRPAASAPPPAAQTETPSDVARALTGTRPWVRLVSVLMFIGAALGLLAAAFTLAVGGRRGVPGSTPTALAQMLMCLLYLIPASLLYRYGSAINVYLRDEAPPALAAALEHQRAFWKFVGVLTLVFFALALLGVLAAILIPAYLAGH